MGTSSSDLDDLLVVVGQNHYAAEHVIKLLELQEHLLGVELSTPP